MDVRQLRYFVAVAQERNFTRAADRLHIAQPPLSRQIQGLEDELGVMLIDRSERPLKLTEAGRFFYEQALQMIGRMDQIRNTTRQLGRSGRSLFVVGCVASTLYGGMPDLARRMRRLWPDMEIELKEMSSTQQVAALKEGRIDLGFGRVRVTDPAIERITLREERLVLALPLDHPKLAHKGPLPLATLEDEMLVLYPSEPRPSFADEVLVLLGDRNVRPRAIREVRELQMALGLVAADDGVTIVPASAQRLRSYDVAYRHFDDPKLVSPIIMSYRANDASGRIEAIKQLIREMYADQPDWLKLSENRLLPP
ncbi:LysR family transcriptional regulator [Xanthobacter versatilis]|uniref:LysR family transcriptional regulator n=1 Tax=Xanthobacter autotrophicus (strain ATCC BAA-1158 / Py2) TaxID=78245 RepID=UPI00372BEE9D